MGPPSPPTFRSAVYVADEAGGQRAAIDAGQGARHRWGEERRVGDLEQMLGDPPEIGLGDHPARMRAVEAGEVDGPRVRAQRALAAQVHVALEVAHHQLAQRAVHRLAVADTREVRLRDGTPVTTRAEDRDDVV